MDLGRGGQASVWADSGDVEGMPAIGPETGVSRRALGACRGAELAPRESWSLVCNCSDINGGAPLVAIEEDCCSSLSNGLNLARS